MVRFSDIIKMKSQDIPRDGSSGGGTGNSTRSKDSLIQDRKISEKRLNDASSYTGEVIDYYEKFIKRAQNIKERVISNQGLTPSPILTDLYSIVQDNIVDELYEYAMLVPGDYDEMIIHTVDVTFIALKVGSGMGLETKILLRLGLAAFLENVGMYKIPSRILNKSGRLEVDEINQIKRHPEISYDILSQMGQGYSWLANVARQVHERMDGSGYPEGLKQDEILELASIIGLVDVYTAMIKKRVYRNKLIQTDAVKSIVEISKGLFPPRIVKSFLTQISMFPVNSYVRLNNRSVGRVISTDKSQPMKPTIELFIDGQGNEVSSRQIIHLAENPLLYIEGNASADEMT